MLESERLYYREIVRKVEVGDPLNDKELEAAIAFYSQLSSMLSVMGSEYRLAFTPVVSTCDMLKSFREARKRCSYA
jgi:hypothetical protein